MKRVGLFVVVAPALFAATSAKASVAQMKAEFEAKTPAAGRSTT